MCLFMVNLNINAMIFVTKYYVQKFLERRRANPHLRSAIINYSSINAIEPQDLLSMYNGTKGFNRLFSNTLYKDY